MPGGKMECSQQQRWEEFISGKPQYADTIKSEQFKEYDYLRRDQTSWGKNKNIFLKNKRG